MTRQPSARRDNYRPYNPSKEPRIKNKSQAGKRATRAMKRYWIPNHELCLRKNTYKFYMDKSIEALRKLQQICSRFDVNLSGLTRIVLHIQEPKMELQPMRKLHKVVRGAAPYRHDWSRSGCDRLVVLLQSSLYFRNVSLEQVGPSVVPYPLGLFL